MFVVLVAQTSRITYYSIMERDKQEYEKIDTLEIDIALKLSQIEGCFKFLHHMNFDDDEQPHLFDKPRNETERQSIKNNLARVQELREMYRALISKHRIVHDPVPAVQIAKGTLTTKTI